MKFEIFPTSFILAEWSEMQKTFWRRLNVVNQHCLTTNPQPVGWQSTSTGPEKQTASIVKKWLIGFLFHWRVIWGSACREHLWLHWSCLIIPAGTNAEMGWRTFPLVSPSSWHANCKAEQCSKSTLRKQHASHPKKYTPNVSVCTNAEQIL